MASDSNVTGLAMGATGPISDVIRGDFNNLRPSGTATATVVDNPLGGNAIMLTNRANSDATIDIWRDTIFDITSDNTYTVRVRGVAGAGEVVAIRSTSADIRIGEVTAGGNGAFDLRIEVTSETLRQRAFGRGLRIFTSGTSDLTIHEIRVTH